MKTSKELEAEIKSLQEKVERLEKIHPEGSHPGHRKRFSEMNYRLTSLEGRNRLPLHDDEINAGFGELQEKVERLENRIDKEGIDIAAAGAWVEVFKRLTSLEANTAKHEQEIGEMGEKVERLNWESNYIKRCNYEMERLTECEERLNVLEDKLEAKQHPPPNPEDTTRNEVNRARALIYKALDILEGR